MNWISSSLFYIVLLTLSLSTYSYSAPLFKTTFSGITLTVSPTINHDYTKAGIKITSPGNQIVSGCTQSANGYCIFSITPQNPATIVFKNLQNDVNVDLCLNGTGPLSCQQYQLQNPTTFFNTSLSGVKISIGSNASTAYSNVGIKIDSPGNSIASGCTPNTNGYCLFSINESTPASIYLNNLQTGMTIDVCVDGLSLNGCQTLHISNPITLYAGTQYGNVLSSIDGGSNWSMLTQPGGSLPWGLFILPNTPSTAGYNMYVGGVNGNLEVSTNGGQSWANAGSQPDSSQVFSVYAVSPDNIYVGTALGNVRYTQDGGKTWNMTLPQPDGNAVLGVAYDSVHSVIYAATSGGLWQYSTGPGWTNTLTNNAVSLFFIDSNHYYIGLVDSTLGPEIGSYINGTWTYSGSGSIAGSPTGISAIPGTTSLYAGTQNSLFQWSNDNGLAWNSLSGSVYESLYIYNNQVYLGDWSGNISISNSITPSWTPTFTALPVQPGGNLNYGLSIGASGNWYVGGANGTVLVSSDRGKSWQASQKFTTGETFQVVEANNTVYATTQDSGLCYVPAAQVISATSWTCADNGGTVLTVQALFVHNNIPYCSNGNRLYTLQNTTLAPQGNPISTVSTIYTLYILTDGTIYAATDTGIYISSDNGNTWSSPLLPPNLPAYSLYINNGSIYAGTADNNIYVSSDGGNNWVSANTKADGSFVYALIAH